MRGSEGERVRRRRTQKVKGRDTKRGGDNEGEGEIERGGER